ncbi:uncharacterized protein [Ptychodera flava]|uniref:uncharacterized protein n=1 Tax=Ptychodera flava TaxID=63121 RepID=UPI003969F914
MPDGPEDDFSSVPMKVPCIHYIEISMFYCRILNNLGENFRRKLKKKGRRRTRVKVIIPSCNVTNIFIGCKCRRAIKFANQMLRYLVIKMAASTATQCACHVVETKRKEPICSFTEKSRAKLLECSEVWINSDGVEKEVAQQLLGECRDQASVGYHRVCYQRFTDKRRLTQAQKRKEKGNLRKTLLTSTSNELSDFDNDDKQHVSPKKRHLRSDPASSSISAAKRKSAYVLPPICIICRRQKQRLDPITKKRSYERLTACETDGRTLIKAAEIKKDEKVLLQLRGQDLVSIEVKYHRSCYLNYTRCVTYTYQKKEEEDSGIMYAPSFKKFCDEVVQKRVIEGRECIAMDVMRNIFIKMINDNEGIDASTYQNASLKRRLQARFGDKLVFIRPEYRHCEILMASREDTGSDSHILNITNTDSESEGSENEMESQSMTTSYDNSQDERLEMVHTAMNIHNILEETEGVNNWPPRAEDLSIQQSRSIVPTKLFNFLAWSTGTSQDFLNSERVDVPEDVELKLLSICQDLIFLSSQGRKVTPKHRSLGMAVRHLTGSSSLIGLLNGLGHCVSHSSVLEHDTALALQQLRSDGLPPGFCKEVFTTLVWDNNDFGEETLSALLGLHVFSGCDSVSAFKGKGKKKMIKMLLGSDTYTGTFHDLGMSWTLPDTLITQIQSFVCDLYGQSGCSNVNEARYNCFRLGLQSDGALPPNKDSLKLHTQRANYQTAIYRRCLQAKMDAPSPHGHGWIVQDSELSIQWMTLPLHQILSSIL